MSYNTAISFDDTTRLIYKAGDPHIYHAINFDDASRFIYKAVPAFEECNSSNLRFEHNWYFWGSKARVAW